MHIRLMMWTASSQQERPVAHGSGPTLRSAMVACFAPLGEAGCRYEERDGQAWVTRRRGKDGAVEAYWRGTPCEIPADAPARLPRPLASEQIADTVPRNVNNADNVPARPRLRSSPPARVRLETPVRPSIRVGGLLGRTAPRPKRERLT